MLHFSHGNAKLNKQTVIFNLPAGKTCPGALYCLSFAVTDENGKRSIRDGEHTQFRCFAASSEVQYDGVYQNRAENLQQIISSLRDGNCADLINQSLQKARKKKTKLVRIHESGDFFNAAYLQAWLMVAQVNPDLKFYCYSKNLPLFVGLELPSNFYFTASHGGKFDHMIEEGMFPRYSKVFKTEADAIAAGFKVDSQDQSCFEEGPFALLVHGTQPAGSEWGKAARANRKIQKAKVKQPVTV
jgi:hypothetical protein